MKKNIPLIIVAIIVVAGAGFWLSTQTSKAPEAPIDIAPVPIGTSTVPGGEVTPTTSPTGGPTGNVTGKTVWRDITGSHWNIVFKVQTSWKVSGTDDAEGELQQVSIGGDTANYFVSRNLRLAEPSKLTYTTINRTIAGKSVPVHVYDKPNTTYAYYEYFALPVGSDTYYFSIKSTVASKKPVQDFIDFITLK